MDEEKLHEFLKENLRLKQDFQPYGNTSFSLELRNPTTDTWESLGSIAIDQDD